MSFLLSLSMGLKILQGAVVRTYLMHKRNMRLNIPLTGFALGSAVIASSQTAYALKAQSTENGKTSDLLTFEPEDPRLRSSECLTNAAKLAVDSTSAVLSQTVYAIIKVEKEYVELIDALIKIMEFQLQVLGHQMEEGKMSDLVLETRHEINQVKQRKQDLNILFASAEKLAEATAEVTFVTGSEYASTSTGERLYSAQSEVKRVQTKSLEAEERLRQAQVHSIEAMNRHAKQEELKSTVTRDVDEDSQAGDTVHGDGET